MGSRPGWSEEYWKRLDQETAWKLRTTCPRCGSAQTYHNPRYNTWRCAQCEYSFVVRGLGVKLPWWKRFFRRGG